MLQALRHVFVISPVVWRITWHSRPRHTARFSSCFSELLIRGAPPSLAHCRGRHSASFDSLSAILNASAVRFPLGAEDFHPPEPTSERCSVRSDLAPPSVHHGAGKRLPRHSIWDTLAIHSKSVGRVCKSKPSKTSRRKTYHTKGQKETGLIAAECSQLPEVYL